MGQVYVAGHRELYLFEYRELYFAFDVHDLTLYNLSIDEYQKIKEYDYTNKHLNDINENTVVHQLFYNKKPVTEIDRNAHIKVPVKAIALEVSNDCNMRCTYCYGDGGSYGGIRELMSRQTAFRCVDFLISHSLDEKELQIIFFGGEPLMNFSTIKAVVEYAKQKEKELGKHFSYGITTNATLLDQERIDFIKENNIITTISIDGPKETHDAHRYFAHGVGSHDKVIAQVQKLLEKKIRLRARATVSDTDLRLSYIEEYLESQGFDDIVLTYIDIDEKSDLYIPEEHFDEIKKEIEILGDRCIEDLLNKGTSKMHTFKVPLERLHFHFKAQRACGAGATYLAFTAKGELYPCHRFSNWKEHKLGDYNSIDLQNDSYINCFVENRTACKECFGRYLCGGNCIHSAALFNGAVSSVHTHYCELYRKVFEVAMYVYYVVNEANPELFSALFESNS